MISKPINIDIFTQSKACLRLFKGWKIHQDNHKSIIMKMSKQKATSTLDSELALGRKYLD